MSEAFDYTPEEWAAEMERAAFEEHVAAQEAHKHALTEKAVMILDSYPHDSKWQNAVDFLNAFAPEKVPYQFSSKGK